MPSSWKLFAAGAALAILAIVAFTRWRRSNRRAIRRAAIAAFDPYDPAQSAAFLKAAAASGKPRGLRWKACELGEDVLFAVDRVSSELFALVAVTVSFEAIEGGDMEDVEAVSNLRSATAVFVHRDGQWSTDGRVVFNLGPAQALAHYHESLEAAPNEG